MGIQFFGRRSQDGTCMTLPMAYRSTVRWLPRIGDIFPDFTANSTEGPISFHNWAEGQWTYLFSHPRAFTAVCSTEIADVASNHVSFDKRGVKPMSLSCDPIGELETWSTDLEKLFNVDIRYPMVSDQDGIIATNTGMMHPKECDSLTIRKSFIIDPSLKIRMILEYPVMVGRNVDEVLRVIDALQVTEAMPVATPAGWQAGDPLLILASTNAEATKNFGSNWTEVNRYMRVLNT